MAKSCRNCPAYWDDDKAIARKFQVDVQTPVCKRYGHLLGKPGLSEGGLQKVAEAFAFRCATAEQPYDGKPFGASGIPRTDIGMGDMSPEGPIQNPPETPDVLPSCAGCVNFVPEDVVRQELGWNMAMCAARGKLLVRGQLTREPKDCDYAQKGDPRKDLDWFHLREEYEEGFKFSGAGNIATSAITVDLDQEVVEPSTYLTDDPVSEEDRACGIRAWRKIVSQRDPSKHTFLPIFDPAHFADEERKKIPVTAGKGNPEHYVDFTDLTFTMAVEMMELEHTPFLWGAPGVGKTESGRYLAWLCQLPFDVISITKSSDVEDLAGKWKLEDRDMVWIDGRLPKRYTKPGVLVIDESNCGPDEVWQFLRPLTTDAKQLVLDAETGTERDRDPWCFLMMTGNPAWDPKNIGAQEIADADGDRVSHVEIELPPEHVERAIIKKACQRDGYEIPDDTITKIMSIADNLRTQIKMNTLTISWGLRPQISVARSTRWYDLETAYKRARLDQLEPDTREQVLMAVRDFIA